MNGLFFTYALGEYNSYFKQLFYKANKAVPHIDVMEKSFAGYMYAVVMENVIVFMFPDLENRARNPLEYRDLWEDFDEEPDEEEEDGEETERLVMSDYILVNSGHLSQDHDIHLDDVVVVESGYKGFEVSKYAIVKELKEMLHIEAEEVINYNQDCSVMLALLALYSDVGLFDWPKEICETRSVNQDGKKERIVTFYDKADGQKKTYSICEVFQAIIAREAEFEELLEDGEDDW